MSSTCPHNMVNFCLLAAEIGWDRLTSLGYPCKFQRVSRLGSVTARHLVVGVSQTLRRWTEGATYIRQGDHQVGHWPTFLVGYNSILHWGRTCISQCQIVFPVSAHFYSSPQCSHCKRCTRCGNSVRTCVCLLHDGIVSKRLHVARCSLHCQT